jgi:ligand-binding sensor domain-containing protein/two-component sensor histidine kinase
LKRNIILIFCLMNCIFVVAQKPVFYFNQTNTGNGLSNNKVNCFLQDQRGFVWIGTDDGLNRYDGLHFTIFRNKPSDTSSLSGNIITDLVEDKQGIIWIATADGGITRYNYQLPVNLQFKQYKHHPENKKSIPVNMVNCLLTNSKGKLWVGTSGAGVLLFNTITQQFELPKLATTSTCTDLCFDEKGRIWAGRQGGGYCFIDSASNNYTIDEQYNNLYAKLPYMAINALLPDENKVWIGSWDKAVYTVGNAKKTIKYSADGVEHFMEDEINCFAKDENDHIYLGGKSKGLQLYNKKENRFYAYQFDASKAGSIASNTIYCIMVDRSGILWVGTDKGISKSNPLENQFVQTFFPTPVPNAVQRIYHCFRYSPNELWIGTNNGIYIEKPDGSIIHKPIKYNNSFLAVTRFFKDEHSGIYYIGTDYTLFILNPINFSVQVLLNTDKDIVMKKLIQSRIVSIIKDTIKNHPVLIVLPYGHFMAIYDFTTKKWISRTDTIAKMVSKYGIKDHLIRKISKEKNGEWLLATAKEGLGIWEKPLSSKIKYAKNTPGNISTISNNHVYDFITSKRNNLWVSTFGGGLHYYNATSNKFFHIPNSANLSEGIETDNEENVWGISNGNIYRYNPIDKKVQFYTLPDINKSGGVKGLIYKDESGEMLVGGIGYFIRFNPLVLKAPHSSNQLYFTDFKIFNTSYANLLVNPTIQLSHQQTYFSFEFSVPEFSSTQPVEYYCMMEGEDKNWVSLGSRNYVEYSNLAGGNYNFKVKAILQGSGRQLETSIQINIIPPFWKRWWFFVMSLFVIGMCIFFIYRYRINELMKRHSIRNKIAQDLHDNMGSTLSSISVYSQVAKIYQEQTRPKELSDVLEKISETSTGMISDMNDIVWSLQPANDNIEKIINRMESFAKPLCVASNIKFDLQFPSSITGLNLPMEIRKNFYLIFKEAINNAVKYSRANVIQVIIEIKNNHICMIIKDNGVGFNQFTNTSGGNGLKNMQRRTEEMQGVWKLNSLPGIEICITIPIP